MHTYKELNIIEYLGFKKLIMPYFMKPVGDKVAGGTCTVIGAYCNGRPAGVAVLMHGKENLGGACQLHTLNVESKFRNKGIGGELLMQVIGKANNIGTASIHLNYGRHYDWSKYLDRLSMRFGFMETSEFEVYSIPITPNELARNLSYFKKVTDIKINTLEPDYSLVTFTALSDKLRKKKKNGLNKWYSHEVDPFSGGGKVNPYSSLVLLKGGHVAGWSDVRDLDCRTVLFNTLFIKEQIRGTGMFTYLLGESIQQLTVQPHITRAIFKTDTGNRLMRTAMPKLLDRFYKISKYKQVYRKGVVNKLI